MFFAITWTKNFQVWSLPASIKAVHFRKLPIILLLCAAIWAHGETPCNTGEFDASYSLLQQLVNRNHPQKGLLAADSLLSAMGARGLQACSLYLNVMLEKGECHELLGEYQTGLDLYHRLTLTALSSEYWSIAAETYMSIARVHEVLQRPQDCKRNLMLAQSLIELHRLSGAASRFAVRYSSYHRFFESRDSAIFYARQAIALGKATGRQRSELDGHLLMGGFSDTTEEAIYHHRSAIKLYLERKAFFGATLQKSSIVKRLMQAGRWQDAKAELDSAHQLVKRVAYNPYYKAIAWGRIYDLRSQVFRHDNQLDSAYQYLSLSRIEERKANVITDQENINQMETAFAIEREKNKVEEEKLQNFYLQVGLCILALFLLGMFYFLLKSIRSSRVVRQQKELLDTKNVELAGLLDKKSLLLAEVHHRVKNNLQVIISLMALRGEHANNEEISQPLEDLSHKVRSISLIHEQLYKTGDFDAVDLQAYFKSLADHFMSLESGESFKINLEIDRIFLNLETVLPIGILFAELVLNSFKYARREGQKLVCSLKINKEKNSHSFAYCDNGHGYENEVLSSNNRSMGGLLISSMVRQLQGKSKIYNDGGAVFTLTFDEKIVSPL